MERRADSEQASIVRRGILLDSTLGAVRAWVYMPANGVSQQVIERVLGSPRQSREADRLALGEPVRLPPPGSQD